uniref:Zinc knuckle CX2CX4HX4C n=1 Tax=Tanacetum cinerariifolium TaxID=118510 RepID=A0A699UFQ2_TANCI|nr:zinc knuckle CX2CX4HX4C [Tanacetum cinerariifolium]
MKTIDIEYEWQPPRCDICKIFDHINDQCPKKAKVTAPTQESDDGFVEVTRKHEKGKQHGNKEASLQPKSNVNGKASTSQTKENKEAASSLMLFLLLRKIMGIPWMTLLMKHGRRWRFIPRRLPRRLVFGLVGKRILLKET